MIWRKKVRRFFFTFEKKHPDYYLVSKTVPNYCVAFLGLIGFICCFMNLIIPGALVFAIVFIVMSIKSAVYYDIYRIYYNQKYEMEEVGSKYSLSNPKTLIIHKG